MSSESQLPTQNHARHQVTETCTEPYAFAPLPFPTRPGSPILTSSRSDGSLMAEDHAVLWTGEELVKQRQVISINTLPDDVLLEIFDHVTDEFELHDEKEAGAAWQLLVHVCRRWRHIVFESPRRLGLRLLCTDRTPARDMLDVWPALPLVILCHPYGYSTRNVDNIMAVLEHSDRVRQIEVSIQSSDMETYLPALQHPFPELAYLRLWLVDRMSVVPDSFLGGFAPRLETLSLSRVPLPGLPNLLFSATHLKKFYFQDIPHSGYFSPDTMATALSRLTNLDYLCLEFESPRSCPDQASRRIPLTRSVLPVFTKFWFKGVSEYLEDLVACIDAPRLDELDITFFNDTVFDTPQLIQFICRTPKSKAFEKAHIIIRDDAAQVDFSSQTSPYRNFNVQIICKGLEWQICTSCLPPLSMLEDLYFHTQSYSQPDPIGNIDNGLWLELLQPFSGVKNLYLIEEFASHIVPSLQELIEGRMTEVLPNLQNIFLGGLGSSGPVEEGIGQFVAARQVAGHPIAVSRWTDEEQRKIFDF